jgi:hypothetical protein
VKNTKQQYRVQHRRARGLRQFTGRKPLSRDEVEAAFRNDSRFPPLLSLDQAAQLAHLAPSTCFRNSVRRGKPIAFWRDRFVVEVMELDSVRKRNKHSKSEENRKEKCTNEAN